jgi:NAD-dependent SIR2 family protein deacetylase
LADHHHSNQQQQHSPLSSCDLAGIAQYIASGRARNIVVMAGAGISVAAGIPDFRTPGTGLYSQLQRFQLPWPEAVFDIRFFRHNPKPFYLLAKVRRSCSCHSVLATSNSSS